MNQNENIVVSSRVSGRVQRLFFKNTGERINRGDVLYEIYSEDLANAQREYLLVLRQHRQNNESNINMKAFEDASKNKLLLWGMTEEQIAGITKSNTPMVITPFISQNEGVITSVTIKEGDYLQQGGEVFQLNSLQTVWLEAQLYTPESGLVNEGDKLDIKVFDYPDKYFTGKVTFINPEINFQSKIMLIRIELPNSNYLFKPGMAATVFIRSKQKRAMALPIDAVLQTAKGNIVWIQNPDCSFESRMVKTGISNSRYIEVTEGLKEGDWVVISGAYLIQSDYQFKKGANPMEGMKM